LPAGDGEEVPEEEEGIVLAPASLSGQSMPTIRPGIVHRLDKGTTGPHTGPRYEGARSILIKAVCQSVVQKGRKE